MPCESPHPLTTDLLAKDTKCWVERPQNEAPGGFKAGCWFALRKLSDSPGEIGSARSHIRTWVDCVLGMENPGQERNARPPKRSAGYYVVPGCRSKAQDTERPREEKAPSKRMAASGKKVGCHWVTHPPSNRRFGGHVRGEERVVCTSEPSGRVRLMVLIAVSTAARRQQLASWMLVRKFFI